MSDLIDREALLRQIDIDSEGEPGYYGDTWKFIDTIKSMPPAELGTNLAELGTDVPDKNVGGLISRQSAVDELVKMLSDCFYADEEVLDAVETTLKELPSAQPEPCEDAVSRLEIIRNLHKYFKEGFEQDKWWNSGHVIHAIMDAPSVTPKQRTGKWIKLDMHRGMADHKCAACEQECYVPTCMGEPMYAFCPNCGAKMEE